MAHCEHRAWHILLFYFRFISGLRTIVRPMMFSFFFFNDPATPEFSPLPLPAAFPICALLVLMLAAKHSREPVFPFVARAIQGGAPRALATIAEIDPALADRLRPVGDSRPFQSARSEEHTSELQSQSNLVCRLLLDKTN